MKRACVAFALVLACGVDLVDAQVRPSTGNNPTTASSGSTVTATTSVNTPVLNAGFVDAGTVLASQLEVGTTAPVSQLHIASSTTNASRGATLSQHSTDAAGIFFRLYKSRGSVTSPTATSSGDYLGSVGADGYDGSAYLPAGGIAWLTEAGATTGVLPTSLVFYTTATTGGGTSSGLGSERVRITSAGTFKMTLGTLQSAVANGASAVAYTLDTASTYSTAGAKLVSWKNNTTEKAYLDKDGMMVAPYFRLSAVGGLANCSSALEGEVIIGGSTGGTSGARTRLCLCTSDGAGTPAYAWVNVVSGTVGNASTCSP